MAVCLRCGYDLRVTPPEAPCPECGLAAHRSVIEHSHPDDCRPRWVATITTAVVMLVIAYVGIAVLLTWMLLFWAGYDFIIFADERMNVIMWGPPAIFLLHAAANFLLSRNDRRGATRGIWRVHRWMVWIVALLPVVGMGLFVCGLQFLLFLFQWTSRWNDELLSISVWLMLAAVLCPALTFFRLRWLAQRLSRPRLAEHVTIVGVGYTASLALMIACASEAWDGIRHADVYFFLAMVSPCALVGLFNLWALLLLFVVSRRFVQSARESRARWRAADSARKIA